MDKLRRTNKALTVLISLVLFSLSTHAKVNLIDIDYLTNQAGEVDIVIKFDEKIKAPSSFTIESPARLVLDFEDVANQMKEKRHFVGIGVTRSLTTLEASDRTRLVVDLDNMVPFDTTLKDDSFIISVGQVDDTLPFNAKAAGANKQQIKNKRQIKAVDFRRGDNGQGRVIISLSDPGIPIDLRQEGNNVIATFIKTTLPSHLIKRLDVNDFGTPVKTLDLVPEGHDVQLVIKSGADTEHLAYQVNDEFIIDVKALTRAQIITRRQEAPTYDGAPLSLNFQDIEVRAVLQLIADFTGINIITTDTVDGNITLRLQNVPWDQALDIILKTKGLAKREQGDVILIAPAEEIAAREQVELEANLQVEQLAPLRTEIIQVNYAVAQEMAEFIQAEGNSLLSERGNIAVDIRTNTLLVRETSQRLEEIRKLITTLDRPVRQVLIEARIVVANDDFSNELGVRFGLTSNGGNNNTSGSLEGTNLLENGIAESLVPLEQRLNVNLPVEVPAGAIGFTISKLPGGTLLDLELSALESEGNGEIISSPKLITANQQEALIESGEEIPFQSVTSADGITEITIQFKRAVLALKVTPQITPDDRVVLALDVHQDTRGEPVNGNFAIDTQKLVTEVLVDNGETVVLGGVYRRTHRNDVEKVPFFGDIPYLGHLFRRSLTIDKKQELLIFVTPKIIKEGLTYG